MLKRTILMVFCTMMLALGSMAQSKVDYVIADNYFPLRSVIAPVDTVILSNQKFFSMFGIAAHMGSDAIPYPINFDKEFVIVVQLPPASRYVEIEPLLLWESEKYLELSYHVNYGQSLSWTMNPTLILIVDQKYWRPCIMCTER